MKKSTENTTVDGAGLVLCVWILHWINYHCFPSDISLSSQGFVVTMDRRPAGNTLHSTNTLSVHSYGEMKGWTCIPVHKAACNHPGTM